MNGKSCHDDVDIKFAESQLWRSLTRRVIKLFGAMRSVLVKIHCDYLLRISPAMMISSSYVTTRIAKDSIKSNGAVNIIAAKKVAPRKE